ncbi:hypothetical protein KUTeg_010819 [Tegillarca granosa]|uniref:C-type lectin domain-containing protein n=1 Tax=Tegillarca granosa TaxID=220873 RepID=A0ABQ9F245_TEGGR|nr:hypothetical protein KUTeg_010819 [Tegillarca granosa]
MSEFQQETNKLALTLNSSNKANLKFRFENIGRQSLFIDVGSLDLCEEGWIDHSGSCFTFVTGYFNWQEAEDLCRSLKANLASIHSIDRQLFLHRVIRMIHGMANVTGYKNSFWISASDSYNEGEWRWAIDGKPLSTGYTNWAPGYPDKNNDTNCAYFAAYVATSFWIDAPCTHRYAAICEKSVNLTNANSMFGFGSKMKAADNSKNQHCIKTHSVFDTFRYILMITLQELTDNIQNTEQTTRVSIISDHLGSEDSKFISEEALVYLMVPKIIVSLSYIDLPIYPITPLFTIFTCGRIVILERKSCRPKSDILIPSITILPPAASINRNRDKVSDDLPAPVLPTIPTSKQ